MTPLAISGLIFVCVGSSVFIGMLVARALPEHHLHPDSKDTVKQGLALIATLSGLVIALLVAATKGAYDANTAAVQKLAADAQLLDRFLTLYGPETQETRQRLRRYCRHVRSLLARGRRPGGRFDPRRSPRGHGGRLRAYFSAASGHRLPAGVRARMSTS